MHVGPAPCYTEFAAQHPFLFDAAPGWWVAASVEAVDAVLGNTACCVRSADEPVPRAMAATPTGEFSGRLVHQIDGPDHNTRKAKAMTALDRLDVSTLMDHAQRHACAALSKVVNLDAALDTDAHFCVPLITMAYALLGNGAGAPACQADTAACLTALSPGASVIAVVQIDAAVGHLQQRSAGSSFTGADADDDSDTDIANPAALLAQTYDTYAGLLGNCIVILSRRVGLTARLRTQPDAIKPFIHEVLCRDVPVQSIHRFVVHDVDLLGHPLHADDKILVLLVGANLDGTTNPDPLRFDVDCTAPRLWIFGGGAHRYPADALATTIVCETVWHLLSLQEVN